MKTDPHPAVMAGSTYGLSILRSKIARLRSAMEGSRDLLIRSLALSSLIAATLEYAFLLRHRLEHRLFDTYIAEAQRTGLCALVRVTLAED